MVTGIAAKAVEFDQQSVIGSAEFRLGLHIGECGGKVLDFIFKQNVLATAAHIQGDHRCQQHNNQHRDQ